jgi:hypothetical protein
MKPKRSQWLDPRTWMAFAHWEVRTIFAAISDDGLSDWKAAVIITALELLGMAALTDALSVYLGRRLIHKSSPYLYLVGFLLIVLNIKGILGKDGRWNRLNSEFESYSAPVRLGGGWAVVLLAILTVIAFGYFGDAQRHLPP